MTVLVSDTFDGDGPLDGRLASDGVHTWSTTAGWATSGGSVQVQGNANNGLVALLGDIDQEYARISSTMVYNLVTTDTDRAHPGIVFRYKDANNYCRAELHESVILLRQCVAGVWTTIGFPSIPGGPIASGTPATVTLDLYVDAVVVEVDGVQCADGEPFGFVDAADFTLHTGFGIRYSVHEGWNPTAWARWDDFEIATTTRKVLNWPRFPAGTRVFPDVTLGAAGEWDSTDINNPNVIPNPAGGWWMSYTGYYNGGTAPGDEIQDMGLATAATLDGPWTKWPGNPSFSEPSAQKWNINGGLVYVESASTYVQVYGTGASALESGIATSTDLVNWTIKDPIPGGGHDNTMRLQEDGTTVEVYFKKNSPIKGIWRAVSTDLGDTWTVDAAPTVTPPAWYEPDTPSFSEVGIWVPPGREGTQMLAAIDRWTGTGTRRDSYLGITVDGGTTWQWALANGGSWLTTGGGDKSRFDPFLEYEAGHLYLYYAGTDQNTITLNAGIQLGHIKTAWDPATLDPDAPPPDPDPDPDPEPTAGRFALRAGVPVAVTGYVVRGGVPVALG